MRPVANVGTFVATSSLRRGATKRRGDDKTGINANTDDSCPQCVKSSKQQSGFTRLSLPFSLFSVLHQLEALLTN